MTGCGRHIGPYPCCTVVCGDCLVLMRDLPDGCVDVVITDPVWPNSVFPGIKPTELFSAACKLISCKRLVVHLGCASDPRFLSGVPSSLPFIRTCWLRYARPSYRGRILMGSDVAYVFGEPPASHDGGRVLPGEWTARNNSEKGWHTGRGDGTSEGIDYESLPHPAPRRTEHVSWLVHWFSVLGDIILDPFLGSGTTAVAAKKLGRHFLGMEISPEYCAIAEERIRLVEAQPALFEAPKAEQLNLVDRND